MDESGRIGESGITEGETGKIDKTAYETGPVEDLFGAMHAFVTAYDRLQLALQEEYAPFGEQLRVAMYTPVKLWGGRPPISLYEIGITHSPDRSVAGKYSMHEEKLEDALRFRGWDVRMMFVQDETGLLARVCDMLIDFREQDLPEEIYAASMRFLNESRRLRAMWS